MNQKPILHFFCGKMAAGKSTLAKKIAAETTAVLISEDVWLSTLYPEEINDFNDYLTYSSRLKAIVLPHVQSLLRQGLPVVLDFPGNTPNQRAWFRSIFEPVRANHVLHYVEASDERCKQQLRKRNQSQPEGAAFTTEAEFNAITQYFQPPTAAEKFTLKTYS